MSPAESTPCAAARRSSLPSRSAEPAPRARPLCAVCQAPVRCARPPCAVRQALCAVYRPPCAVRPAPCGVPAPLCGAPGPLYGASGPLCGVPGPLCGAPGPPVRCAETRRSRLAALRRNEICMRGIPVQNKGGTASFASPLFGGGGAFLFVFARTRKAPPQSLFAHARSPLPRRKAPAHACRPVKQRIKPPPARMTRRSALYRHTQHIHTQQPAHTTHPHTHFLF